MLLRQIEEDVAWDNSDVVILLPLCDDNRDFIH